MKNIIPAILLFVIATGLPACGFRPLYATTQGANGASGLQNVAIETITTTEEIRPFVEQAFSRRSSLTPSQAEYELLVTITEQAQRLAVQIDASVSRYNYSLIGNYVLTNRKTGEQIRGRSVTFASFNVVDSQYSTLFAEKAAREKAANSLVDEIERDFLLQIAADPDQ